MSDSDLYEWQRDALASWRAAGRHGVIEAITGTGKTRVGIAAIRECLMDGGKALVLVPTTALLRQWADVLDQSLPGRVIGLLGDGKAASLTRVDVLVSTVHSASTRQVLPVGADGILVADECHRYGAQSFSAALDERFSARLGLTATFERNDDGIARHLAPYFGGVVFGYSFAEALADDVIAPFRVGLLGVRLTAREQAEYEEHRDAAAKARTSLVNRFGLPSEPYGEFMAAASRMSKGWSPGARLARRFLSSFAKYREILASTPQKLAVIPELSPLVGDAGGTLLFAETIKASEGLAAGLRGRGVPAKALHSGMKTRERQQVLEDFRRRTTIAVAAPRVLDEGIDVPEADLGIVVAASQTRRQMIQRMGRVIRRKVDGRAARVLILYVIETGEDPAQGGHEAFLEEIRQVADEWRTFTGAQLPELIAFMEAAPAPLPLDHHGWWETWSTNEPARGLEVEPLTTALEDPWWADASSGDFAGAAASPAGSSLPEWIIDVRAKRSAEPDDIARVVRAVAEDIVPLDASATERLSSSRLVNLIAAHPDPVARSLIRTEAERLRLMAEKNQEEMDLEETPSQPVRVRRPSGEPSILMEPDTNEFWQP